jgi:hypothetical protein
LIVEEKLILALIYLTHQFEEKTTKLPSLEKEGCPEGGVVGKDYRFQNANSESVVK